MPEGLTGNLAQMPLADMLRMLVAGRQTGRLELTDRAEHGAIYLRDGAVVHAAEGPETGERAFQNLVAWTTGHFRFEAQIAAPAVTLTGDVSELLAQAEQFVHERRIVREAIPSTDRMVRLNPATPAAPVSLEPFEWTIVAAIGGGAEIAALPLLLDRDEFTLLKALSRLSNAGLVEIERIARPAEVQASAGADFFRVLGTAAAAALGPMAPVIIDEEIAALGSSRDAFPVDRISSLVERVAGEIMDLDQRTRFQQTLVAAIRAAA